jgi:hypothetical protein
MGRFLRGVLAWLCLCGLGLCTAAPTAAVLPAAFAETTLVDFGAAKLALTVNGAVAPEPVPDPVDPARTVLKLSYPAAATGDAEGPALKLPAAALSRVDWRGRDFLALRVYTPTTRRWTSFCPSAKARRATTCRRRCSPRSGTRSSSRWQSCWRRS